MLTVARHMRQQSNISKKQGQEINIASQPVLSEPRCVLSYFMEGKYVFPEAAKSRRSVFSLERSARERKGEISRHKRFVEQKIPISHA